MEINSKELVGRYDEKLNEKISEQQRFLCTLSQ